MAATKVQAAYRGKAGRRQAQERQDQKKAQGDAATTIEHKDSYADDPFEETGDDVEVTGGNDEEYAEDQWEDDGDAPDASMTERNGLEHSGFEGEDSDLGDYQQEDRADD